MAKRWGRRNTMRGLWALGLLLPVCSPLRDLTIYSRGESPPQEGGAGGLGGANEGHGPGGSGLGGLPQGPAVCGDGLPEGPEDCDAAGPSADCRRDCRKRICPEGASCQYFEGVHWAFQEQSATPLEAREACVGMGMQLALPRSPRENVALRHLASNLALGTLHIGIFPGETGGEWLDANGTVLWLGGNLGQPAQGQFVGFADGVPDEIAAENSCVLMYRDGSWDDESCELSLPFACESRELPISTCGDGIADEVEVCDPGNNTSSCDADCSLPRCGDGHLNEAAGEICDDGNGENWDACSNDCTQTGLLAHFPLTERTGEVAWDMASFQHNGELMGGAMFDSEGFGVPLDGSTQYVEVPLSRAPSVIGPITMALMIQPKLPLPLGFQNLMEHYSVNSETWLRLLDSTLMAGSWKNPAQDSANLSAEFEAGSWHHVVGRYNGKRWALFVDGTLQSSTPATLGALDLDGPWAFGGRSGGRYFSGSIRSVRIYDRDLTSEEVFALYQHEKSNSRDK